jgi:argininosuccinate lyase
VVGGVVRRAIEQGKRLSELSPQELAEHSSLLDEEFYSLLKPTESLEQKRSEGGTSSLRVREQLERAEAALASAS